MVRPKKHLGQHFLRDENIARKITELLPAETENVVEIGPGTGVLTKYLLTIKNLNSWFFEVDDESVEYLTATYPQISSKLFHEDFLTADLSGIPAPFVVIGNFPYNISSQILFRILDFRNEVPVVIGMFQKEVAERIASPPGSRKYGILSVLLQAFYDIEYMFTVNENVFVPPPKVKSAVIRLVRNQVKNLKCDEKKFTVVVKTAFNQRRKTLRNALKSLSFSDNETPVLKQLMEKRAEQLTVEQFETITNMLT